MKISERKLKKAEQEINATLNELLKPYRGLIGVSPTIKVTFYGKRDGADVLYDKYEGKHNSHGSLEWKSLSSGKMEITVFKPE